MTALAIRKSTWNNLNSTQQRVLRWGLVRLDLGVPAEYRANGTRWFIFHDHRITLTDVAQLGTLIKGIATFSNHTPPTRAILDEDGNVVRTVVDKRATKQDLVNYVRNNWVDPTTLTIPEDEDAASFVLSAQGAPNSIQAAGSVPESWSPAEVT